MSEGVIDTSPRGAPRLQLNGYYYTVNQATRQANDYIRWQCSNCFKYKCYAKTKSKEFDGIVMVQNPSPVHNHERVC